MPAIILLEVVNTSDSGFSVKVIKPDRLLFVK